MKTLMIALMLTGCTTAQPVPVLVDGKPTGETYTPPACNTKADLALLTFLSIFGGQAQNTAAPCK